MDGDIDVSMIGAVGKDAIGSDMKDALEDDGVDVSRVHINEDYMTGQADIMVEIQTGESRVCLTTGANHSLRAHDFHSLESISGREGVKPDLLILQLEIHRDVVEQILDTARREGVPVLLNPAPAINLLSPSWNSVTHLIANESEAAALSGRKLETIQAQGYTSGWKAVADEFLGYGVKYVVITLGANGAIYADRIGEGVHLEAEKVQKVVDATTAGDTFVGAYAASIIRQNPNEVDMGEAVRRGLKAAAYVVQRAGTQATIPWAGQLLDRRQSVYGSF
jgi:ribokinase